MWDTYIAICDIEHRHEYYWHSVRADSLKEAVRKLILGAMDEGDGEEEYKENLEHFDDAVDQIIRVPSFGAAETIWEKWVFNKRTGFSTRSIKEILNKE